MSRDRLLICGVCGVQCLEPVCAGCTLVMALVAKALKPCAACSCPFIPERDELLCPVCNQVIDPETEQLLEERHFELPDE